MNIKTIKKYLTSKIGSKIILIYHGSRNRQEKYVGVLFRIYNNIFVIRLSDGTIKSFNYFDILTKTVQIYI